MSNNTSSTGSAGKWNSTSTAAVGLGIDEFVDSVCDIVEVGEKIGKSLSDGFQVTDLITVLEVSPIVKEVYTDRKVAIAQMLNTDSAEADLALERIATRLNLVNAAPATVRGKVYAGLSLVTRGYHLIESNIQFVQDAAQFARDLRA